LTIPGRIQTTGKIEPCQTEIAPSDFRLGDMSSHELLRYGFGLKSRCSVLECQEGTEALVEELSQLRTEWRKRHPEMPLRDTF
jgi:hypothetical protein